MRELLNFIRPPEDADWKTVNRWRWNVCLTLLVLTGAVVVLYKQAAWAGDVDSKIAAASKELKDEQAKTNDKVDRLSGLLIAQLANAKAAEIRLTISKRCKTTGYVEREELMREKERLQEEYISLRGVKYDEPDCGDL